MSGIGGAVGGSKGTDPQVRVRIFAYLRTNGLATVEANVVARKLVFAMVGKGALPECTATLAGAAVARVIPGETKSAGFLEPKAEPYEFGGTSAARPIGGGALPGRPGSVGGLPGKIGGVRSLGKVGGGFSGRPGGGHRGPIAGAGAATDFAIIEPIMSRREVPRRRTRPSAAGPSPRRAPPLPRTTGGGGASRTPSTSGP